MTEWTRIAPGVYDDGEGSMHIDVVELLDANGYEDTPENREALVAAAHDVMDPAGVEVIEE